MKFIGHEARRRHAFLEQAVQEFDEVMPIVEAEGVLAADVVAALHKNRNNAYLTKTKHGEILFPEEYAETEAVPLLALRPGERAYHSPALRTLTPRQWQAARMQFGTLPERTDDAAHGVTEDMIMAMLGAAPGIDIGKNIGLMAVLHRVHAYSSSVGERLVQLRERPIVALNMDRLTQMPRWYGGLVLLHEWAHAWQVLREPCRPDNDPEIIQMLRCEFEARHYHALAVGALGVRKMIDARYPDFIPLQKFELVRSRYAEADDPFGPTERLLRMLMSVQLNTDQLLQM